MRKIYFRVTLCFLVILITFTAGYCFYINDVSSNTRFGEEKVLLNEIRELTVKEDGSSPAEEQIQKVEKDISLQEGDRTKYQLFRYIMIIMVCIFIYLLIIFCYFYLNLIRPFSILEQYANQIAAGNLEIELKQKRTNFFGAFTWAFDHLRKELLKARRNEARAVTDNKIIIATLSHDIKTPIASIRAYAEGLEANLDSSYEKREHYIQVIMNKCDEVTTLTNDLVLHSLSELDKLEMKNHKIEIAQVLQSIVKDFEYSQITLIQPIPEAELMIDEKRLAQVIENILNNARKYAENTAVNIRAKIENSEYIIYIKDNGAGIPAEDMPFVFNKFYRGHNAAHQSGSGLGLYIVKYILNRMNGTIKLVNCIDGLEVIIFLKIS